MRMKKIRHGLLSIGLLGFFSCNVAPDGFFAPSGSTVEVEGGGTSFDISDTTQYVLVSGKVKIPEKATSTTPTIPGNNIFVQLTCSNCLIFDKADGQSILIADVTKLKEIGNAMTLSTDSKGLFQVVISLAPPSDTNVSSYKAKLSASISVDSADYEVTVSDPAASE